MSRAQNSRNPTSAMLRGFRPWAYFKNLLLLIGALYLPGRPDVSGLWTAALAAMAAFCLLSSSVYLFNDIHDLEQDRRHPEKRLRPLASGLITLPQVLIMAVSCAAAGLALIHVEIPRLWLPACVFLTLNAAYSMRLSRIPWLEMACVASSYTVRAWAGLTVLNGPGGAWAILATFSAGLAGVACKRRAELMTAEGYFNRRSAAGYTPGALTPLILAASALSSASYVLLCASLQMESPLMLLTIPWALLILARYLFLVFRRDQGEHPERTFVSDTSLLSLSLAWAAFLLFFLGGIIHFEQ